MNQDTQVLNIYQTDGREAAIEFLTATKGFSVEAANDYLLRLEDTGGSSVEVAPRSEDRFMGDLDEDDEVNELLDDEDID